MAKVLEDGKIQFNDGKTMTVEEIEDGYMLKSDYTKKTQEIAELRKKYDGVDLDTISKEAQRATEWDRWYYANKDRIEKAMSEDPNKNLNPGDVDVEKEQLKKDIKTLQDSIKTLQGEGMGKINTLTTELNQTRNALKYMDELDDIRMKHTSTYPNIAFDKQKVLTAAYESKKTLNDAYNDVYREDFLNIETDKRVAEKLKAAEEKRTADRISDGGETGVKFLKMPEQAPQTTDRIGDALRIVSREKATRGEI